MPAGIFTETVPADAELVVGKVKENAALSLSFSSLDMIFGIQAVGWAKLPQTKAGCRGPRSGYGRSYE